MRADASAMWDLRLPHPPSAFAPFVLFRGKLPSCHLSRTAGFVCFVSFVVKIFWPRRNYCNFLQLPAITRNFLRLFTAIYGYFPIFPPPSPYFPHKNFSHDLATFCPPVGRPAIAGCAPPFWQLGTWNLELGTHYEPQP
jgi:hypothetical protein